MTDTAPPTPGEEVGSWTLVQPIARGGMGEVWRAEPRDGGSRPDAAIKFIIPDRLGVDADGSADADGAARARFAREVAASRRVASPHVAEVLDADTGGERPWVASRYVDGPTLAARVGADGPLSEAEVRTLGWELAAGLAAIHAAGVVHRDLTPANVVMGPAGPVIVDFGISRVEGAATITQTGSVVGTPAWMAPEQLRDDEVSDATDVWALGAVLAYAATGRPVVEASRTEAVIAKVLEGDIDLGGLPEWLVPVVTAALASEPSHRPTADEVPALMRSASSRPAEAVTEVIAPDPVTSPRPPPADDVATEPGPSEGAGAPPDAGRRSRLWVRVVGAAVGFAAGSLVPPLGAVILFALCAVLAGGLRIWNQERGGGRPSLVSPSAVGLVGTVALVTSLSTVIGVVFAVLVVLLVVIVFIVLGGDVM